jgi:ribosomal protein S18 acetylase RimI-like enzyme
MMLEAYDLHPDAFTSTRSDREGLALTWWEARLHAGPAASQRVFGAFVSDRLAGVAGVSFETRDKSRHKSLLFGMYVPESERQQGIADQLVRAALDAARARPGVRVMQLSVTEGNVPAQRLYEKHGFVTFGTEPLAMALADGFASKAHMWAKLS